VKSTLKLMPKNIDTVYKEVVNRIVKERRRQNITQEQLAVMSAIDRTHMGSIEQGRRRPTLGTLHKLAAALNMTLEQLFKGL
jgi:transcriptional regulator with XRE-family HTH domain